MSAGPAPSGGSRGEAVPAARGARVPWLVAPRPASDADPPVPSEGPCGDTGALDHPGSCARLKSLNHICKVHFALRGHVHRCQVPRRGYSGCGALFSPPHHVMGSGWAGRVLARSPLSEALSQCPVGVPHGTPAGRPPAQGSRSGFLRKREARASSCGGTEVTVPLRGTG